MANRLESSFTKPGLSRLLKMGRFMLMVLTLVIIEKMTSFDIRMMLSNGCRNASTLRLSRESKKGKRHEKSVRLGRIPHRRDVVTNFCQGFGDGPTAINVDTVLTRQSYPYKVTYYTRGHSAGYGDVETSCDFKSSACVTEHLQLEGDYTVVYVHLGL
nr:hypothetical protein HmN_000970300 [Hymenolepis microstoma]